MPLDQLTNEELDKMRYNEAGELEQSADDKEMSFLEHLEELRWHLIRALLVMTLCMMVAFGFGTWIFENIIFAPARSDFWTYRQLCALADWLNSPFLCINKLEFKLQSRTLTGQFMMHLTYSFIVGFIVSFPYIFWEIWRFVRPGLYTKEQSVARGAVFYVSTLFMLGVLFGYYVVAPLSINFLANYQISGLISNEFDIVAYVSTVVSLVLACAILFQLPVVVYFLARVGVVTPKFMRTYRRHSIVAILIVSAIITPSPDIFSQLLVGIPLMLLYELSISIAARVEKQRIAAEEQV
jgi:sec-independent protein translocase protein TatC